MHLEENFRRIARLGYRVTLLTSQYPGGKREEEVEGLRILRRGHEYTFNFSVPGAVRRLLRAEPFDLVVEDINKIPFYTPWFHHKPLLAIVPHLFADSVFREINFILGTYIFLAERPIPFIYRGRRFVVISESTKADLIRRGIPEDNITVSCCGIDHTLYSPDKKVAKSGQPTMLYLGRLKKYKSVDHLIRALPHVQVKVPDAQVVIIGEGDDRPRLEKITRSLGLVANVQFLGFVAPDEKVNWLRRAQVAVCPSLKEGWGLTNIEANACGTPAVAADVPGLRDSVSDGTSGLLYPYGDVAQLAERLIRILTDVRLRGNLERGALAWARKFQWDTAARELAGVIDEVVGRERR